MQSISFDIVLPVLLGFVAVYLLLPRPRALPVVWGAAAAALALLLAGWWLIDRRMVLPELLLFYAFSTIAVVSGGLLVTQRNPVRAALSFALVVLSTCGLFLLQAAPFLMAATIIIYAGAIIVTFIFVIMLAQQEGLSDADHRSREPFLSSVAGFVLLGSLLAILHSTYQTRKLDDLLARIASASKASTVEQAQSLLGNKMDFRESWQLEVIKMHPDTQENKVLAEALNDVDWSWRPDGDAAKLREGLTTLYQHGMIVRNRYGSLQPPADIPQSTMSQMVPKPKPGELPAENVAYLGRSLFSDYVLDVELGGTLLLVATIGAIAIAGRRPEAAP